MKQEIIDFAGLSYPDKRDCGVRQRVKTNTNDTNYTNHGTTDTVQPQSTDEKENV